MKFACENCGTRYTLSDEKIRNRLLKIRCKICENVIVISGQPQSALSDSGGLQAAPPPAEVEWFCAHAGGDPDGPMPEERLHDRIRRGELGLADLVWTEAFSKWTPIAEVAALAALVRREPARPPALPPRLPAQPPRPPALPPALAARASQARGMPAPLAPPGGALLQPAEAPAPPPPPEADMTEAMANLPAGLAARIVEEGRETLAWAPAPERETVSVAPDPALLAASLRNADTVQAPALSDASEITFDRLVPSEAGEALSEEGAFDTALAPVLGPPGGTDVLPLITPPPPPASVTPLQLSEPPAPMVIVPSPRAQATTVPAPVKAAPRPTEQSETIEERPSGARALASAFFGHDDHALGDDLPEPVAAPPPPAPARSYGLLIVAGLVLLGGGLGLGLYFGRKPEPVAAPDATAAAVLPPVDAARPPPDAARPPPDAAVPDAAVPDAAVPDAAPPSAAPPSVAVKAVRKAPASAPPTAPTTEAASGALAALDRGRSEAPVPVEPAVDTTPLAELPETLDQASIVAVIKGHQRGVHGCYQRQLKRDPSMRQANVKLAFTIEKSGQTSNVKIDDKYAGTDLASCLDRLVRRWRFPPFRGESIPVEYPLIFTASL